MFPSLGTCSNKYDFVFEDEHEKTDMSADHSASKKSKKKKHRSCSKSKDEETASKKSKKNKHGSPSKSSDEEPRNRKHRADVEVSDGKSMKNQAKHSFSENDGYNKESKSRSEVHSREAIKSKHAEYRRYSRSSSREDRHRVCVFCFWFLVRFLFMKVMLFIHLGITIPGSGILETGMR